MPSRYVYSFENLRVEENSRGLVRTANGGTLRKAQVSS